jgi:hypothetical protein
MEAEPGMDRLCETFWPRRCGLALALAALAWYAGFPLDHAAHAAAADTTTPASPVPMPQVTVVAPRAPTAEELAGDSVENFLIAHARPSLATGQLARWHAPVCAATLGLSQGFNSFVSARIAAVAAKVGAPSGAADCKPNIHIYFTSDPQTVIEGVAKQAPELLGYHAVSETRKVTTISHPIEGWYATATEGDKGFVQLDQPVELNSSAEAPGTGPARLQGKTPSGRAGSRLMAERSSLMVHVLILVDVRKVTGYEIGPISDYLAVLVLSQTRQQDACGQLPSILDLMAPNCDRDKPTAITAGDLAFLHALYRSELRTNYYMEKGSIESKMFEDLKPH